jgi:hypothetical protein
VAQQPEPGQQIHGATIGQTGVRFMAVKLEQQIPDNLTDEVRLCLQEMRLVPIWTAQKFEHFATFKQLARRKRYVLFTADVRDFR